MKKRPFLAPLALSIAALTGTAVAGNQLGRSLFPPKTCRALPWHHRLQTSFSRGTGTLTIFPTRISRVTFIAWFPRIAQLTFVACFRVFRLNVLEQSPREKQSDNTCELRFSNSVYSIGAIKKAAYRFTDRCSFDFQPAEDNTTLAILSFSADVTADEKAALQREFRNEVLDQDLREVIGAETAGVRNAVLAYAFSRTGLQGGDAV